MDENLIINYQQEVELVQGENSHNRNNLSNVDNGSGAKSKFNHSLKIQKST